MHTPEVYKDEIFDRSIDAFSYGVILHEICHSSSFFFISRGNFFLYTDTFLNRFYYILNNL